MAVTAWKQVIRFRPIADIRTLLHVGPMDAPTIKIMRASLWLLFAAAACVATFWMVVVLASNFEVWRESNTAGVTLQAVLLLYPIVLLIAVRRSSASLPGTYTTFAIAWSLAAGALFVLGVPWWQGLTSSGACTEQGCRWP